MKNYKIKIWGNELHCPICGKSFFNYKTIKIIDYNNYNENEVRYLFECINCGHSMMFGAITRWEPKEELNFILEEV